MKTKNKALLLSLCAVLLVAASVFGTLAYLTSSDSVVNTFTVGNVQIKLDEAKVGDDGKALTGNDAARVQANSYHLLPGHVYDKDPTVTVLEGSEESYVRLLVTVNFKNTLTDEQLATDLDAIFTDVSKSWIRNAKEVKNNVTVGEGDDAKTYGTVITYEYRYTNSTVGATTEDTKLDPLFKGISIPGTWDNKTLSDIGGFEISIVGQAIQADGFANADAAWAKF